MPDQISIGPSMKAELAIRLNQRFPCEPERFCLPAEQAEREAAVNAALVRDFSRLLLENSLYLQGNWLFVEAQRLPVCVDTEVVVSIMHELGLAIKGVRFLVMREKRGLRPRRVRCRRPARRKGRSNRHLE